MNQSMLTSVNKNGYMGVDFKLMLPTIDDLTQKLVKIGKGAHIFKLDVSRTFRLLNVDPRDYDLLGVNWGETYMDTRILFGSRHRSQIFQRTSNTVVNIMCQRDINVINYIDDFLRFGMSSMVTNHLTYLLMS